MENSSVNTREKNRDVFGKKTNRWPVFIVAAVLVVIVVIVHFVLDRRQKKEIEEIDSNIQSLLNRIAVLSRIETSEDINTGKFQNALPQETNYSTHIINEEIEAYAIRSGISTSDSAYSLSTSLVNTCPISGVASNVYCGQTAFTAPADKKESIINFLNFLRNDERYYYISDVSVDTNSTIYVMSLVIYTFYVVG